ncbi:MAG: M18 family aminopeptidase [Candidatus Lambdaproteobacteria bacterium RIFOXYD1_FULL_56_27]|uniref:M18 family aminopeptidase n=1 Tax=Candidatus Lambdaproteobacteria bacterium RIFOXYD2_FULL_56_26 TaxID=1817773 RepID=A0A1F6H3J5_9PROT|nr:MAG: M18 family aminopeptidase [Candidatus Lambdaproteobacteria bacterium RIFOXYC1_FULL_56_13]OGH04958.1 MAG: M18 family aminopeptidase [Candidatus Lambdaproteobacteria bacterium RIFOXYD2_FULL_56_26]OGH09423.1 MAG: M18 family aminopeptidase [Candidatus Lambdaproteobacteria bacterium RIFOXYD1_FULL_56_27]
MNQPAQGLMAFLNESPTPFHATAAAIGRLKEAGFVELQEAESWNPKKGGKYWVTRNDSSLIAFVLGSDLGKGGFRFLGAHTDSPGLKVKPRGDEDKKGHWALGVEVYGGVLLATWFDRDLSIAGKVCYLDRKGATQTQLLDLKEPVGIIPNLAIHLRREANDGWKINPQKELTPVLGLAGADKGDLKALLAKKIKGAKEVLDFDLFFYPVEGPRLMGINKEMITGARLDNLVSCFAAVQAISAHRPGPSAMMVLNDHEEVGSGSFTGAAGNFLESVLERLLPQPEDRGRAMAASHFLSADNAHGLHPNYAEMHDERHAPVLGGGLVIKTNAGQSYITDAESSGRFQSLCKDKKIPFQHFAIRADLRCGSTIGPLTARRIGVRGLDIGVPNWAMHSARETVAVKDLGYLVELMQAWLGE